MSTKIKLFRGVKSGYKTAFNLHYNYNNILNLSLFIK